MDGNFCHVKLVSQAQVGDERSIARLSELIRPRLYEFVYRNTLQRDSAEDIVQETLLEMFKILGKLKKADRFWPWLYRIALNKIRLHYRKEQRHKASLKHTINFDEVYEDKKEELANVVNKELKQIIITSMEQLKPKHRTVLAMRCYDDMTFPVIAETMGCSEFSARKSFYRAKKALVKQLASRGLGKGSLLMALVLFGKMTATTEAAAAQISVTAAMVKVGTAATVAAVVASKTTVISLATAGVIAVGTTAVLTPETNKNDATRMERMSQILPVLKETTLNNDNEKRFYYYPSNSNGAVMMKLVKIRSGGQSHCQWLQNSMGNYYRYKNTIYMNNYRIWSNDLSVLRLPTDSPKLTAFISQVEGNIDRTEYIPNRPDGLLIISRQNESGDLSYETYSRDVSYQESFRYDWPKRARNVDNRDAMHRRGWTHFIVEGKINGRAIYGKGRIPFVYEASLWYPPWLRLRIGDKGFIEPKGEALFKGLSRPWMGLHTIDTIRRDAAEQGLWFETKLSSDGTKAEVTLNTKNGKLIYTIDMVTDVVEMIVFIDAENFQVKGRLRFSYLQDIDEDSNEFSEPISSRYGDLEESDGILWLVRLMEGNLVNNLN